MDLRVVYGERLFILTVKIRLFEGLLPRPYENTHSTLPSAMGESTDDWQDYGLEQRHSGACIIHYILYLLELLGRIVYSIIIFLHEAFNAVLLILVLKTSPPLRSHSGKRCRDCHRTPKVFFRMRDCFGYQWEGLSYFENRTNCWDPIIIRSCHGSTVASKPCCQKWKFNNASFYKYQTCEMKRSCNRFHDYPDQATFPSRFLSFAKIFN